MKRLYKILLLTLLSSCSVISIFQAEKKENLNYSEKDFISHMAATGPWYVKSDNINLAVVDQDSLDYLGEVYDRLVSSNQPLLNNKERPSFYFVKSNSPFLFSLPNSQFFFSTSLMEKFLKSEEVFVAAFAAELIKSHRAFYERKITIPLGFYETEKMIKMTRLKLQAKQQLNEWTFHVLRRASFDSSAYLNWIQIQNRNSLDFAMYVDDPTSLTREEQLYKNFISKQGIFGADRKITEANSSKKFYKLLNNLVRSK